MGKLRKKYNWRARVFPSGNSSTLPGAKIEVAVDFDIRTEKYDDSNPLVLPSNGVKANESLHQETVKKKRKLSQKQRKRLKKLLEKKQKNVNRADLLKKLQEVQATPEELQFMTSTSSMQTFGLNEKNSISTLVSDAKSVMKINTIKGAYRKKNMLSQNLKKKFAPNIAGVSSSSSDDEEEEEKEDDSNINSDKSSQLNSIVELKILECPQKMTKDQSYSCAVSNIVCPSINSTTANEIASIKISAIENKSNSSICNQTEHCPAVFVPVKRAPEIQAAREALPIYLEEQSIMEAIREHPVIVIHGETGSGKTTQVPQFLYEAGYTLNEKLIGITEPRRIAAVQMSARVAKEMNLPDAVSYHIRYEKNAVDGKTQIKFMTDGVLLKEMRRDFLLTKYSVVIVDEAHERSVFSDVLIGLLSRCILMREKKNDPLKLVIMSATLRIEDFTSNRNLFKEEPFLVKLESRQHKVVSHFEKETPSDYIQAAYNKVCKIHRKLPAGGVLVFVTGEEEVRRLCKMLRETFCSKKRSRSRKVNGKTSKPTDHETNACSEEESESPALTKKMRRKLREEKDYKSVADCPKIDLDKYSSKPCSSNSDDEAINLDDDENDLIMNTPVSEPLYVLPLYSFLSAGEQAKVFQAPPRGSRLCVISTNVAETSVTIPGLKYVVDTGKVKVREYDKFSSDISNFSVMWTSKASAEQRKGRAGRTEGGHCYRLYSSAVYENYFPEFMQPDIQRLPVDDILLQMKSLGITSVVNFPFPSPPDMDALKAAEKRLVALGALENLKRHGRYKNMRKWEYSAKITTIGKVMARLPLSPRFSKMLMASKVYGVISYGIALVSAMTVPEVFHTQPFAKASSDVGDNTKENSSDHSRIQQIGAGTGKMAKLGDTVILLRAVSAYEGWHNKAKQCQKFNIRHKAMIEIRKMRLQLIRELNEIYSDLNLSNDLTLEPPNENELEMIRKVVCSGLTDHVARKFSAEELLKDQEHLRNAYQCLDIDEPVYIHPSSVLVKNMPEYVVYQEIIKTSKHYMRTCVELDPEWVVSFAPNMCHFSSPLETPEPYYDKKSDSIMAAFSATFGCRNWKLPLVVKDMERSQEKYKWFCYFLLNGDILPQLAVYKDDLLSSSMVMLKPWSKIVPRTQYLLQAVINEEIDTKAALLKVWENKPQYLLQEYCEWLPQSKHNTVIAKWSSLST